MSSLARIFRRGYSSVVGRGDLIQILSSELKHEQSSDQFQRYRGGSLGNFELSWNEGRSKDVVLRRKFASGEEIALSALLGPFNDGGEDSFPFQVLMKICIKKPQLSSLLQFDCVIANNAPGLPEFSVSGAYYLESPSCLDNSVYRGPDFRDLDPQLQATFKEYLKDKGIDEDLTDFLILHLHRKEKDQYMDWLGKVRSIISKKE